MEGDEVVALGIPGIIKKRCKTRVHLMTYNGKYMTVKPSEAVLVYENDEKTRNINIAIAYINDKPPNYKRALPALRIAADLGCTMAQCQLGYMYDIGLGVRRDPREAIRYYELGIAAPKPDPDVEFNLALRYLDSNPELQNEPRAAMLFERAANGGLCHAQYNTGVMYETGYGVEVNLPLAIKYFKMCAAQGNEYAMK